MKQKLKSKFKFIIKTSVLLALISVSIFSIVGCNMMNIGENEDEIETLIIADQFGLAYAPIEIMKQKGFLEEALKNNGLDNIEIKWQKFGNTVAIREAMLSGSLDIGFVGIPPFLLALDNGMPWKIMTGLSESNVSLITKDPKINTLSDLKQNNRVILPQPGSIQHILLMMASDNNIGDAHQYDEQLISLSHPDGVVAFTSGESGQLHFTTPPYIQEDLKVKGAHEILNGQDAFGGEFTFIVGVCQESLYKDQKKYQSFMDALDQSFEFIEKSPKETYTILSENYDYTPKEIETYLAPNQMQFSSEVKGIDRFVSFLRSTNQLKSDYNKDALFWVDK